MHHREIVIESGGHSIKAVLNDTATAVRIWESLPLSGNVNFWGDEIYFEIPVKGEKDEEKDTVELGDLGYWKPGNAFCIFFGKTPLSTTEKIKPASPVVIIGKISENKDICKKMTKGEKITIKEKIVISN